MLSHRQNPRRVTEGCPVQHSERGSVPELKINSMRDLAAELPEGLDQEAEEILTEFYRGEGFAGRQRVRLAAARRALAVGEDYLAPQELSYACQVAWRNSARCIGRLSWRALRILDRRSLSDEDSIFEALVEHLRLATNGGRILPFASVFASFRDPGSSVRVWNHELISYAGYRAPDGTMLGDPVNERITGAALALGWDPGERSAFDPLPLIIQIGRRPPRLYEIPKDAILEVRLVHPHYAWFERLRLKWFALPVISDMVLDAGGVRFPCAPFNGWYMSTEIGARDLGDESRYNCLPKIAARMGLETGRNRTLWKDRALIELNAAVLHSFDRAGVRIVDHHRASKEFIEFCEQERRLGREATADWSWIVPPISGSATEVFHQDFRCTVRKPNFFYQQPVPALQPPPVTRPRRSPSVLMAFRVISGRRAAAAALGQRPS